MEPTGSNLIDGAERRGGDATARAVDPRTGETVGPTVHDATAAEVQAAVDAAVAAAPALRDADAATLAGLLDAAADGLEALGDTLVEVADRETGLGTQRIVGERARTCGQLRAFAALVRDGTHLEVRIDTADGSTTPPRPDLRRMQVAIGPVAVFGASNFPLAFSVPGGDTASALAAGCPVVIKAHPSHPATSELCARVLLDAARSVGLPDGTVSLLHGHDVEVSRALVAAAGIRAVGFTGSQAAGRALYDVGASREEPIPVYAEMGSLNPQFVTAGALAARGEEVASGLVGSMTMGTGQFCTKPGLVIVPDDDAGRRFEGHVVAAAAEVEPTPLLNEGISTGLRQRLATTTELPDVEVLHATEDDHPGLDGPGLLAGPTVLATSAAALLRTPALLEEHFGPVTVLVRASWPDEALQVAAELPGSLSACVHGEDAEGERLRPLLTQLRERAGRVVWNQFPTGVTVAPAMHHGGPWPATTFPAHTSVGTAAITRFLRPVSYQNVPPALLPAALHDDNPLGLWRLVDGELTREPIS